jgi:hypothetical protein
VPNSIALDKSRGIHAGVPTFFRALCCEAALGGDRGYHTPGYHLAIALGNEQPGDICFDEWGEEIDNLKLLLDDDDVWQWFRAHFPKMMALVPSRRRDQFVSGVRDAHDEGRVAL